MGPTARKRGDAIVQRLRRGPVDWQGVVRAAGVNRNRLQEVIADARVIARESKLIIPRPVFADGYLYRVTGTHYATITDPGILDSTVVFLRDNLTRGETTVEHMTASLEGMATNRTKLAKLLRTLQSQLESANAMVDFVQDQLEQDRLNNLP